MSPETMPAMPDKKPKMRVRIDLGEFPKVEGDMDDAIDLHIKGRVCGLQHNEYCHDMEIEVDSVNQIGGEHATKRIALINPADQELTKLRRRSL